MSEEKIAVFDLDGTITYKDTYVDFLLFCLKKRPSRILRGGALVIYLAAYKSGIRSNHWLKAKFLGTVAGGLNTDQLDRICESFADRTVRDNFKPKALAELQRLREEGYTLVLATASFGFYVTRLHSALQMDYLLCSTAKLDGEGRVTGAIEGKNCIGPEKASRLKKLSDERGWTRIDRAYSDDIVDLPLFEMADDVIVIDPGPATEAKATDLGFKIIPWR